MTTSKPSQPPLFADGSESDSLFDPTPLWPTPAVKDTGRDVESYMAMKRGMPGGERRTITQLTTAVKAGSISSRPAIPASHSLSPGSAWARKMTGTSGRSLRRWLPNSALGGCFWRMFTATSRWGSTRCYLTWKRSATPAGRSLFRLVPSAPPTGAIASGFSQSMWPTPQTPNGGRAWPEDAEIVGNSAWPEDAEIVGNSAYRPNGQKVQIHLHHAVERGMFPTSRHEGFDAGSHRGKPDSLHSHVKMFQTPRAIYGEHPGMSDPSHLSGQAGANASTGMKLSAAWTARLMGYPDGWLDLDE